MPAAMHTAAAPMRSKNVLRAAQRKRHLLAATLAAHKRHARTIRIADGLRGQW